MFIFSSFAVAINVWAGVWGILAHSHPLAAAFNFGIAAWIAMLEIGGKR